MSADRKATTRFRCRSAIRQRVEDEGQKFANRSGVTVLVFGVMGGYEARDQTQGGPKGSSRLLATLTPQVRTGKPPADPLAEARARSHAKPTPQPKRGEPAPKKPAQTAPSAPLVPATAH